MRKAPFNAKNRVRAYKIVLLPYQIGRRNISAGPSFAKKINNRYDRSTC